MAAVILAHKPRWAETDDLLQDVAATLVRKIGQVREEAAFRPWLRTVAINIARAAARGQHHEPLSFSSAVTGGRGEPELAAGPARDVPTDDEARVEGRRLLELAGQLPEGYREPLLLRCLHDMSYRQIGVIVGLPETTIETRIARGRRMLRELARAASSGNLPAAGPARARQSLGC